MCFEFLKEYILVNSRLKMDCSSHFLPGAAFMEKCTVNTALLPFPSATVEVQCLVKVEKLQRNTWNQGEVK